MFYDRTVLDNGITVISERIDSVRSVALGVWVAAGSRDEEPAEAGVSHFIEHMMFKGTPTRSAQDISEAFERLGAEVNAFTSKEFTCYYSRVIDRHAPDAFGIIADMVTDSLMEESACVSEREVVLEEISRAEDTPDDKVHDLFAQTLWPEPPASAVPSWAARTRSASFLPPDVFSYTGRRYRAGDVVVAAAGNVEHADVVRDRPGARWPACRRESAPCGTSATPDAGTSRVRRDEGHRAGAHLLGHAGSARAPTRTASRSASSTPCSGGGMASRLFQEIREKRGLAYAVVLVSRPVPGHRAA